MIEKFLTQDAIWLDCSCSDKRSLLRFIAGRVSTMIHVSLYNILDGLIAREALQSTAVGHGIAVPHCTVHHFEGVFGCFIRTKDPIDFESLDHKPVDLFFCIISSVNAGTDHLRLLARVSRLLRQEEICYKLRSAIHEKDLLSIFVNNDK